MALTCGLIGLPLVGKTTLFNLLTRAGAETSNFAGRTKTNVHTAGIPDARLDFLAQSLSPPQVYPCRFGGHRRAGPDPWSGGRLPGYGA